MDKQRLGGHAAALSCELVWGTTFAVTKLLQENLAPIEILFLRFVVGYLTLFALSPRRITFAGKRRELLYAGAGLSGGVGLQGALGMARDDVPQGALNGTLLGGGHAA